MRAINRLFLHKSKKRPNERLCVIGSWRVVPHNGARCRLLRSQWQLGVGPGKGSMQNTDVAGDRTKERGIDE